MLANTTCRNAYSDRIMISKIQCTTITIVLSLISVITIPLNGLIAIAILKTKKTAADPLSWYYMLLITLSGCSIGTLVIPVNVVLFTTECQIRNCSLEYSAIFIGQIVCQFSAYVTFLIAIHRYFISTPDRNRRCSFFTSKTGAHKLTIIAFLISMLHGFVSVNFFGKLSTSLPNVIMKAVDFILGLTIYFIYLRLYITIHRYAKNIRVRFQDNFELRPMHSARIIRRPKYVRSLAVTISLILIALAICYIPFLIMDLWTSFYTFIKEEHSPRNVRFVYFLSYAFVFLTSVANGGIILHRNRDIREFVKVSVWLSD